MARGKVSGSGAPGGQGPDGEATPPRQDRSTAQSVLRASRLLRELARRPAGATVVELARATGLDRTVTHRLLTSLGADALVEKEGAVYYAGRATVSLAAAHTQHSHIRQAALPYLVELHSALEQTSWIVALGVAGLGEAILVDRLWKRRLPLSIMDAVGTAMALDRSALGRCLMAYSEEADRWLPEPLEPWLQERLELIRASGGLEISFGEIRSAMGAVACAILNSGGRAIAGVVVSGPNIEAELSPTSELSGMVASTARAISRTVAGVTRPEYRYQGKPVKEPPSAVRVT